MCRFSRFLNPGGWGKAAAVGLYFIFSGICTLSLAGVFSLLLALDSSSSFPCPAFRAIAKSAGVFSLLLALDSSSSFPCSAFRTIAKSLPVESDGHVLYGTPLTFTSDIFSCSVELASMNLAIWGLSSI
ncbi:hypothetical protein STEG23_012594 [Scotinomys teguina]